jgi:hypothetical protein
MRLPCRWGEGGLKGFAGTVRYRRRFGWPGRLDADEHVWLTFGGVEAAAEVWLNGSRVGRRQTAGPFEFEVTSLLQVRNQLTVEVEAAGDHGGLWGEVALEVRGPAYLRAVRAALAPAGTAARLHVRGEVVGIWARPLELYALFDGANVLYATVTADPSGRPFDLLGEELSCPTGARRDVRVELVSVSTVWYQVEGMLPGPGEPAEAGIYLHPPA